MARFPWIPIILREQGGRGRTAILSQSDMPRDQGALTLGGSVRQKVDYYPGSSIPAAQVMGPKEAELEIAGVFEDRKKGVPGHAMAQMLLLDSMRRTAAPVLFIWGPVIRRCLWKELTFQTFEFARIAYGIKLEVIDHGFGDRRRFFAEGGLFSKIPGLQKIVGVVDSLRDALSNFGLITTAAGDILSVIDAAKAKAEESDLVVDDMLTSTTVVQTESASTALERVEETRKELRKAQEMLESQTELKLGEMQPTSAAQVTGRRLEQAASLSELANAVVTVEEQRAVLRELASRARTTAIYVASEGDTLQRVAARIYGDPSRWTDILEASKLTSPSITAGTILVLPGAKLAGAA